MSLESEVRYPVRMVIERYDEAFGGWQRGLVYGAETPDSPIGGFMMTPAVIQRLGLALMETFDQVMNDIK